MLILAGIVLFIIIAIFSYVILEEEYREHKKQQGIQHCIDCCKDQKELGICSGQCDDCVFNVNNMYPEDKCL